MNNKLINQLKQLEYTDIIVKDGYILGYNKYKEHIWGKIDKNTIKHFERWKNFFM